MSVLNNRIVVAAAWTMILAACSEPVVQQENVARPVKMVTVEGPEAAPSIEYPGVLSASQSTEIGFEVSGKIIEFPVREGQQVAAGDVLALLDPRDYQAKLNRAQARLDAATADYNRYKELVEQGWVSQQRFERETLSHEAALADFQTAEKALQDSTLRAPFAGNIARKIGDNFQNVQAREPILEIHDVSSLEIDINIPEQDFVRVERGLSTEEITRRASPMVIIPTAPDQPIPARVKSFTTTADPMTRTFGVTLAFNPPQGLNLLPGMTARIRITPSRGDLGRASIRVPATAVLADDDGNAFVWRYDAATAAVEAVPVEVGRLIGNEAEIISGLSPGDRVAISGISSLRAGMKVYELAG